MRPDRRPQLRTNTCEEWSCVPAQSRSMRTTFRSVQVITCHFNIGRINRRDLKNGSSVTAATNSRRCGKHSRLRLAVAISDQALTDKNLRMPVAKRLLAEIWLGRARRMRSNGNVRQTVAESSASDKSPSAVIKPSCAGAIG